MGFTKFNVFLVADGHNCSNYKPEINFQVLVIRAFLLQLAAGGFMLGGMLGSGNSLETFMQKPLAIPTLIIMIIVLVPAVISWPGDFLKPVLAITWKYCRRT